MILSDQDIKKMLKQGKIKVEPLEDSQIGPASIDLTLDDEWQFFKEQLKKKTIDLSKTGFQTAFKTTRRKTITLKPGQMCLAKTVEMVTLPADIMGKLEGRSRFARMGLVIHITSALVQPGSNNHQVLEIVNLAPFPVKLHAGMRISQMVLEKLESPTTKPYRKFGSIAVKQ
ncbi:dCTP deaminase [Candidatus Micrarchaeota archaeon]|nr:dCTP deaminase [Candidatus Micrarchaeota archaeon]MBU1166173.1 dCTP deaminase [Candidatus Micrarchaeota archaeon]MBU1886571.1 dCTP deaminase [Candidatus Micrarchaeota archaeon]